MGDSSLESQVELTETKILKILTKNDPVECIIGKYKDKFDSVRSYWEHVAAMDGLNMIEFFEKYQYHGYIRVVNYLRRHKESLKQKFMSTSELYKLYDSEIV